MIIISFFTHYVSVFRIAKSSKMWVILIVIGLFVLLLVGLLLISLEVELNTYKNIYEIRIGAIARARLEITDEGDVETKLKIGWYTKKIKLFPFIQSKKAENKKPTTDDKKRQKPKIKNVFKRIIAVLKSFKVKKFYIDLDTGDYILNAYLYPLFFIAKINLNSDIQINFSGYTNVNILIKNNILRMCVAFIKYNK